jgi:hypothetical protein
MITCHISHSRRLEIPVNLWIIHDINNLPQFQRSQVTFLVCLSGGVGFAGKSGLWPVTYGVDIEEPQAAYTRKNLFFYRDNRVDRTP